MSGILEEFSPKEGLSEYQKFTFQKQIRRRKLKFNPNSEYLEASRCEYLRSGGTVTVIERVGGEFIETIKRG